MTVAVVSRVAPFGSITTYRVVVGVEQVLFALKAWNTRRVTRNALARLSDHLLADIGLTSRDI